MSVLIYLSGKGYLLETLVPLVQLTRNSEALASVWLRLG